MLTESLRFNLLDAAKPPSAQTRYMNEIKRVVGVLNGVLAKSASGWLVGDKCTYADLAFFMWDEQIETIMTPFPGEWDAAVFAHFKKWHERMLERPAVRKVVDDKEKLTSTMKH